LVLFFFFHPCALFRLSAGSRHGPFSPLGSYFLFFFLFSLYTLIPIVVSLFPSSVFSKTGPGGATYPLKKGVAQGIFYQTCDVFFLMGSSFPVFSVTFLPPPPGEFGF